MTLEPYTPERLDALVLRVLDLAAPLRDMARRARDEQLTEIPLHDRKALDWLTQLEEWVLKATSDFALVAARNRGAQRGAKAAAKR